MEIGETWPGLAFALAPSLLLFLLLLLRPTRLGRLRLVLIMGNLLWRVLVEAKEEQEGSSVAADIAVL